MPHVWGLLPARGTPPSPRAAAWPERPRGAPRAPRVHIAPMMQVTHRHMRYFCRLLSKRLVLWSEMVKDTSITYNQDRHQLDRHGTGRIASSNGQLTKSLPTMKSLEIHGGQAGVTGCRFPAGEEHPVVLQLGGSDPETLAHAVRLASPWSYDEINLNCGCPSEAAVKTRQGHGFGAQLMTCPELVRACTEAMQEAASVGVSVKCRIWTHPTLADLERDGDRFDTRRELEGGTQPERETLLRFVDTVSAGGVRRFIVHARSGILAGLKASENRKRPPLHHDFVEELQRERPELELTLNGGICSLEEIEETRAKGLEVMVGRWAVQQPWAFADESARARGRGAILQDYLAYARRELQEHREDHLSILADPLRNLFAGVKKSGEYRRVLSEALSSSPREVRHPSVGATRAFVFLMFMGLCVMCAFFLVLLMMPPLLVAVEKQKESAKLRVVDISSGQGVAAMQDEQKKKKKQKGTVMQAILFRLMSGIGACPCVILACTGIFFLTSVICVVTNAKLSTVGCTQYGEKQTPCSSVRTSLRLNMIAAGVHTNDIGLSEYI
eukprot:g773.t1